MTQEPYQAMLDLLLADLSPQEAAQIIFPLLGHTWEAPTRLPASAPASLQNFRDLMAWRRFEADQPTSLQLIAAHFLFRAAASLSDLDDLEASLVLFGLAKRALRDVLLVWLGGRECPHCIELRQKLESYSP